MLDQISEMRMHWLRWILTVSWLLIIASLFYDPWSVTLTEPNHPWSPLRLTNECIEVQGECLVQHPCALGATIFWGVIVPGAILILLIFGHELWRRICPLSFLSQIPRALGWQRQLKRENTKTGKVRYELAKVKSDSWLGKNYLYLQFGWLFVGLCGRILFFDSHRFILAFWLLLTIICAIAVGYLYGGKSWCNYFCPMAPVQKIYSQPGGLFASKAHTSEQSITQSMCRMVLADGKEQSACVACQNPCIDIDSERAYWDGLNKPEESFLRYGYVGLVVGYFLYYYLYAGNWNYYFSGAWARQSDQLASLFEPGFYWLGEPINIPKICAVPLTLGICTTLGYWVGKITEKQVKSYSRRHYPYLTKEKIRHRIFTVCTFAIFNFFFIFSGRSLIVLLPLWVQYIYKVGLVVISTLWFDKTWRRNLELYSRESFANRFRKQLEKLGLNVSRFLEGKTLNDLNIHEVYVLAKVLPGFSQEKRHQAYKGVLREALEEGYVNYSSSLEVLQQMRQELGITDDEHRQVLEELGIEDPELLNPHRQRNLENQIRLNGYRKSLERLMKLQNQPKNDSTLEQFLPRNAAEIRTLGCQYSVTSEEQNWIFNQLVPAMSIVGKAEFLLTQLPDAIACYRLLNQPRLKNSQVVLRLLQENVHHKKELMVRTILQSLVELQNEAKAMEIAQSLGKLSPMVLTELLETNNWRERLHPDVLPYLTQVGKEPLVCSLEHSSQEILNHLEILIQEPNPLIQAACLYIIAQLDEAIGKTKARDFIGTIAPSLVKETAEILLSHSGYLPLNIFPKLEKLVYLYNSDFFHGMHHETLLALTDCAEVKTYSQEQIITEAGDTCRELLLLIEGDAQIRFHLNSDEIRVISLHPGQTLDELEVLAHSESKNTIVANSELTRILAIPVDKFDDLLHVDADFARRVLEMESRQLQRFIKSLQPA